MTRKVGKIELSLMIARELRKLSGVQLAAIARTYLPKDTVISYWGDSADKEAFTVNKVFGMTGPKEKEK